MTKRLFKIALGLLLLSPVFLWGAYSLFGVYLNIHMLRVCESNLREARDAVVAYRKEHGTLPLTLRETLPEHGKNINCPMRDTDSYTPGYVVSADGKDFTICCKGAASHSLSGPDLPRIDGAGKIDRGADVPWYYRKFLPL